MKTGNTEGTRRGMSPLRLGSSTGRGSRAGRIGVVMLALLAAACAPHRPVPGPPPPDVETPAPPDPMPRAVYIIHGDADYLYHDADGNRKRADEEAARAAREAARQPEAGEVFLFHQRTGAWRKLAGTRAGIFEHYRAGMLVDKTVYRRRDAGFGSEAALLHERGGRSAAPQRLRLAYFGHEIIVGTPSAPDGPTARAEATARVPDLAGFTEGLREIAEALGSGSSPDDDADTLRPYELVVLSTCYGGTPAMMRALAPLAHLAVASPAYLHLSYLDARALARGGTEGAKALADTIAQASFDRLRERTSTEITVAVYDLRAVTPPADVGSRLPLNEASSETSPPLAGSSAPREARWDECGQADVSWGGNEEASRGVSLHYQPPRFGPGKDKASRSAWQCRF